MKDNIGEDEASHLGKTSIPPDEEEDNGLEEHILSAGPQNEEIPPLGPLNQQGQQAQIRAWKYKGCHPLEI